MLIKKILPLLVFLSLVLHAKTINEAPQEVFGSSPPMNYLLYAINPQKMAGLNFDAKNLNNDADERYLSKTFLELPVIGTFHSTGAGMNVETILKYNPDLILVWEDDYLHEKVSQEIAKTKIPTLTLPFRKIDAMASSILLASEAIGEKERGEQLSAYTKERMAYVKRVLEGVQPTRYYYAEGVDGLATECSDSFHVEALNYAGGENVHQCTQSNLRGLERITFETLLGYNPEVIIAQNRLVYNEIVSNPLWQHLKAVQKKRVYLVPNRPFNWIDRPPSFMRIIGIEWLAYRFHPEVYRADIYTQIKKFYKLFLDVELTNEEIQQILGEA
ncbi:ABC transporter substrate-binding protein [Sulfurovum sp.]|uniref:ABC transporter substrate-binding protein n=1 Tax=Sulfurovum sp. TaxID=1969726 RepID=UPI002A36753E|nr:ABC transporter substrate-binding protein [Sulfurovum sp.]MDD2450831.1 ABC transporter substrate-binding protein [Sulfurovum sp.]MDD3498786.1 ABC transporter substrate-binding protein [Sulfurovum sp.]MDY0402065.1 ABC transporter substrate-binding protein [Sulfurovum sp.]